MVTWTDLGDVASLTYPQIAGVGPARTVCSSYANGWLVGVTDVGAGTCLGGTSLASLSYHPNGMLNQISHGNGVADAFVKDPNDMGRPARISTSNALSNRDSGSFEYDGAGNIKALRGMVEPVARSAPTGQLYDYDAFGNLTRVTNNDTTYQDLPTSTSTNRLTGSGYDGAGNLTAWTDYTYGYDALNGMTTLTGGGLNKAYTYDANGERVSFKDVPSNTTTYTLRGLDGKVLREYSYNGSSWSKDYVYRGGRLLAAIDSSGTSHFHLDHLGSPRLITNSDLGRTMRAYHAYYGFGEETGTDWDSERMKFTGHERDLQGTTGSIDDLDYMHARYTNPNLGRFLNVDPVRGDPRSPQSWNLYAYVKNNPVNLVDPTGTVDEFGTGVVPIGTSGMVQSRPDSPEAKAAQATLQANKVNEQAQTTTQVTSTSTAAEKQQGPRDTTPQLRQSILAQGETYLGDTYLRGGKTHEGIDCSHLVSNAINEAGVPYKYSDTSTMAQNPALRSIPASQAKTGDIVVFKTHTGIYNANPPQPGRNLLSAQSGANRVMYGRIGWFGTPTFYRVQVLGTP